MISTPRRTPKPKIQRTSIKDFLKGTVTALDDGRTPVNGLRRSGNLIIDQDGILRPRPSLVRYGTQPLGTILGEIGEFVKYDSGTQTNETWQITMQNVSSTTKIYVSKDGGSWTVCNGKTYDNSARAHFSQVDDKVLITNGTDTLSYLDIPTLAVIPFTALTTPSAPTPVQTGMAGTTYTYWYQITANSTVGETAGSAAASVQTVALRDLWVQGTQYITVSWSAVASAQSYNVYLATVDPSGGGTATLIAAGVNGLSYKDEGTAVQDVNHPAPLSDTTAGPKATRSSIINGQVFLTGDKDNPHFVRFGGTGTSVLDFSPFDGGGWTEIGRGTKELPVRVMPFRDGRGTAQITVLCRGTNGTGKRYLMTPQTVTVGDTIIAFFEVTEDNGQDGTDSPDGVVLYQDSLWYPSRDGFKTTGTKPQLQNILSTNTVSETILDDVRNLNNLVMDKCVGLAYQGRIYWALPNGTSTNNQVWVLDINREGAWMEPWNIAADWMMLYNDNNGQTHHIVLSNNIIYELSYAQMTTDDGVAFATNAVSGLIKFSEDTLEWAKVIDISFVFLRPQGLITMTISGKTEDSSTAPLGEGELDSDSAASVAGWGEAGWGGSPDMSVPTIFGWSNWTEVPVIFASASELLTIEVDEEVNNLQWELSSTQAGTDFALADVIVRWVDLGVKDLT